MTAWLRVMRRHGTRRTGAPAAGAGRHASAVDADRQAHQCRISECRLDAAGQHHDAGAGHRQPRHAASGAPQRRAPPPPAAASAAPRCRSQEAGRAEACASRAGSSRRLRSPRAPSPGGRERLMLSKPRSRPLTARSELHRSCSDSNHATSSHQARRRLRFRQGTQGMGRRADANREEEGPAAAPHPRHPDDAEARPTRSSRAVRSTG